VLLSVRPSARLEALQQEVAASAVRVKRMNQDPKAPRPQAPRPQPYCPASAQSTTHAAGGGGARNFTGGLKAPPAPQAEIVENSSADEEDEDEDEDGVEDEEEWTRGSARGELLCTIK